MAEEIVDGTGAAFKAEVDKDNNLHTFSTTQTQLASISEKDGNSFVFASGFLTFTQTSAFNATMFIEYTGDGTLFIDKIRSCGTATSMNSLQVQLRKNPTAGTIVDSAVTATAIPSNLGSSKTFTGNVYTTSADEQNFTDGTIFSQYTTHLPGHSIQDYQGALILPKGSSLGIECKTSIANEEMCFEIQGWITGE